MVVSGAMIPSFCLAREGDNESNVQCGPLVFQCPPSRGPLGLFQPLDIMLLPPFIFRVQCRGSLFSVGNGVIFLSHFHLVLDRRGQ